MFLEHCITCIVILDLVLDCACASIPKIILYDWDQYHDSERYISSASSSYGYSSTQTTHRHAQPIGLRALLEKKQQTEPSTLRLLYRRMLHAIT